MATRSMINTVGGLIDELTKYPRATLIKGSCYVVNVTAAGTDMSGNEERSIIEVTDLESRVVVVLSEDPD